MKHNQGPFKVLNHFARFWKFLAKKARYASPEGDPRTPQHWCVHIHTVIVLYLFPWPALLSGLLNASSLSPLNKECPEAEDCVLATGLESLLLGDLSFLCWRHLVHSESCTQWVLWMHPFLLHQLLFVAEGPCITEVVRPSFILCHQV